MPVFCQAGELDGDLQVWLAGVGPETPVDVIIDLVDRDLSALEADTSPASNRSQRIAAQVRRLRRRNMSDDPAVAKLLDGARAQQRRSLWLINGVATRVSARYLRTLAGSDLVYRIRRDNRFRLQEPVSLQAVTSSKAAGGGDNAALVNAAALWQQGYTGSGVVVAVMDTGVDGSHPDLASQWRGGSNSWFDPFGDYATPQDADGHGTRVTGVIVGNNGTGIAPDASWIAARIFDNSLGTSASTIHAAFQWLLDPDHNPQTDDAPDVVNASWGLDGDIGACNSEFQGDIDALVQAGIVVVFAAGNYGPDPSTSVPPANGSGVMSTGAVDASGAIASFSSRGPSACDGGIFPKITAPGVDILTTDLSFNGLVTDPYVIVSGTSIAAPFTTGVSALLHQIDPEASVAKLYTAITDSAVDRGDVGPDNTYGYGVLDALAAATILPNVIPPVVNDPIPSDRKRSSDGLLPGIGGLGVWFLLLLPVWLLARGRRPASARFAAPLLVIMISAAAWLPPASADTAASRGAPVQTFEAPVFDLDAGAVELGKRLYREGITASGKPVEGIVAGDVRITGTQLACVYCHKRSAFGATEGEVVTPQITGDVLYTPLVSRAAEIYQLRAADKKTRPAYDDATLAHAITAGSNPEGRQLDALMPRYVLGDEDRYNLISYLKSLSARVSDGADATTIHMAVVLDKNVDVEARRAVLRIMRRFMRDRNADTRPHTARAEKSPWTKKWHYESHRIWELRVWELDGDPDTWDRQLEVLYAQQPAFAVLGGILGRSGDVLASFCERKEMPCLFPISEFPATGDYYYSVWFSKGLMLEAETLAGWLHEHKPADGPVLQVVGKHGGTDAVAQFLADRLRTRSGIEINTVSISDKKALAGAVATAGTVVYWLDDQELNAAAGLKHRDGAQIYLSAQRTDVIDKLATIPLPAGKGVQVAMMYPYLLPQDMSVRMRGTERWLELRKIAMQDKDALANTLYSAELIARTMKHLGSNYSREYLLERLEHLDRDVAISPIYPRISLGPGQRYGSKGAYIVRLVTGTDGSRKLEALSDWIVPD